MQLETLNFRRKDFLPTFALFQSKYLASKLFFDLILLELYIRPRLNQFVVFV